MTSLQFSEKPTDLLHLKTRWARSVFHWYDYLATIFVSSLGTTDQMLQSADALTNFQPVILNKYKLERWFFKTDWP